MRLSRAPKSASPMGKLIVAALLGGTYRRRMRGLLFRLHKAAALTALYLTLLHWVWYYL